MNALINTTGSGPTTMSTREIAEICDKRHADVMRDCRVLFSELELGESSFAFTYIDTQNKERPEYRLPRDLTMTLVTGYSIPLRKKVIDRLDELERRLADPATVLNDPAAMRGLLLTYTEKVIALESRVEEMQSDVDALEQIADANGSFCRTETAKHLGIPPHVLIKWMRTNGWTYRRPGAKEDIAYQSKLATGYLEHKVSSGPRPDGTEWISTQVRVTPKGLTVLAKAFPKSARAA